MTRRSNKQRRARAKARRKERDEEVQPPVDLDVPEQKTHDFADLDVLMEQKTQEITNFEEAMRNQGSRWGEFGTHDDMPGRTFRYKPDPVETECIICDRKFDEDDEDRRVGNLPCMCASTLCRECVLKLIRQNGKTCSNPHCNKIHFRCPTCKREIRTSM